jgi:2-dehydropantoate 2-reductase
VGEPDGSRSERCDRLAHSFQQAGLRCAVRSRIRHDIWVKLIGNLAFNPVSALTRATLSEMIAEPATLELARRLMKEGEAVARAVGVTPEIGVEQRIEAVTRVGGHKTSMLQDLESGKPLELDAIAGAVLELAESAGIDAPHLRAVYACTKLLAKSV